MRTCQVQKSLKRHKDEIMCPASLRLRKGIGIIIRIIITTILIINAHRLASPFRRFKEDELQKKDTLYQRTVDARKDILESALVFSVASRTLGCNKLYVFPPAS